MGATGRRDRCQRLGGALGARGGEHRRGRPASGGCVQQASLLAGDLQGEPPAAELERLRGAQRELGGPEHERLGAPQSSEARRQVARDHKQPAGRRDPLRDPLDQGAGVSVSAVDVVEHKGIPLTAQRVEHRIDDRREIVTGARHRTGRIRQPGARDRGSQADRKQLRRHAPGFERHPDRQRPPHVDQFGRQHRLAVAAGRLDDDDPLIGAGSRQPRTADVMRRQATQ